MLKMNKSCITSRYLIYISLYLIVFTKGCLCKNETVNQTLDQQDNLKTKQGLIQICGFRSETNPNAFPRIVGGDTAKKYEFPWQASITIKKRGRVFLLCGASVIGASWVLTAAHCTVKHNPKGLTVVAGDYQISRIEGTEQIRRVAGIYQHRGYNAVSQENDISILRIFGPFYLDGMNVAPVCLPHPGQKFHGKCVASGWGKIGEQGFKADILQKALLPIIDNGYCRKRLHSLGYENALKPKMMCAGYKSGRIDACQGDSGGPFVCPGQGNLPYIAGIVSWGIGCARKDVPGIYTEVSQYVGWINRQIHGHIRSEEHLTDLKTHVTPSTREFDTVNLREYRDFNEIEAISQIPLVSESEIGPLNYNSDRAMLYNANKGSSEENDSLDSSEEYSHESSEEYSLESSEEYSLESSEEYSLESGSSEHSQRLKYEGRLKQIIYPV